MLRMVDPLIALAQAGGGQSDIGSSCMQMLPMMAIIVGIFYFMVIRPQRKQATEHQRFLDRLKEGDRVVMACGILGRIAKLEADLVTLDVGDRTKIRFLRSQVSRPLNESGSDEGSESREDSTAKKRK